MADRSTGPVQPPVIDLTARNTNARPEDKPAAGEATPGVNRRNDAPRFSLDGANWPLLGGAAIGGARARHPPHLSHRQPAAAAQSRPRRPRSAARADCAGRKARRPIGAVTSLQESGARTQISLDATIAQLDAGLAAVNKSIADVEASIPEAQPPWTSRRCRMSSRR